MKLIKDTVLNGKKHLHFIGIGGSGMFPIAKFLHSLGIYITGSDGIINDNTIFLENLGIKVFKGHSIENVKGSDLVIYSAAIMSDNIELVFSRENNIDILERSEVLGIITTLFKKSICVSGTHGKTTTSSMISQILNKSNVKPITIIGGNQIKFNSQMIIKPLNQQKYLNESLPETILCEACEFADTFLKLKSNISIILNIDEDHLEYFKSLENIIKSFSKFCEDTTDCIIINGDDYNTLEASKDYKRKIITFGFGKNCVYYAENIQSLNIGKTSFDLFKNGEKFESLEINMLGNHNVLNCLASIACCDILGVDFDIIKKNLENFDGVSRRFQFLGRVNEGIIMDDYAHHPLEIKMTIESLKKLNPERIRVVFQPFTYSRTYNLLKDFADVLNLADEVILTEIMGGREKNTYNIYSDDLVKLLDKGKIIDDFRSISNYIKGSIKKGDIVITIGCGNVYLAGRMMVDQG